LRLRIVLPSGVFLDEEVAKIVGESPAGSFCLLPRHIDYVTALVPGILSYRTMQGEERFLAVERGVLVKQGDRVLIAVRHAVKGVLGALKQEVDKMILDMDERERKTRSSVARLEAGFVRRFMEFGKRG
jgi:F-type H+-transporting ATPase subunit epsilon